MNRRMAIALGVLGVLAGAYGVMWWLGQGGIEGIMKRGFARGTLLDQIRNGKAGPDELKQFADYCRQLCELRPKKGDEAGWTQRTTALRDAAEALAKGEETARARVVTAANCNACHAAHK